MTDKTDRELLEQALEALEVLTDNYDDDSSVGIEIDAIIALRERLAQPEREWQGLTDEEIDEIAGSAGYGYINIARATEAKLKEKND